MIMSKCIYGNTIKEASYSLYCAKGTRLYNMKELSLLANDIKDFIKRDKIAYVYNIQGKKDIKMFTIIDKSVIVENEDGDGWNLIPSTVKNAIIPYCD